MRFSSATTFSVCPCAPPPDVPPEMIGPVQEGTIFSVMSEAMRARILARAVPVHVYHTPHAVMVSNRGASLSAQTQKSRSDIAAMKLLEKEKRLGNITADGGGGVGGGGAGSHRRHPLHDLVSGAAVAMAQSRNNEVLFVRARKIGNRRVQMRRE